MEEEKKTHVQLGYADVVLNMEVGEKICERCGYFRAFGAFGYDALLGMRGYCFMHCTGKAKWESCEMWHSRRFTEEE